MLEPKWLRIHLVAFWIHFGVLLPEKINAKTSNGKDQENHQKKMFL
jgi:hypothetical protein